MGSALRYPAQHEEKQLSNIVSNYIAILSNGKANTYMHVFSPSENLSNISCNFYSFNDVNLIFMCLKKYYSQKMQVR